MVNPQDASLSNLHDIVVPAPPPLFPPAPGVWILLIIAVAVVLALALWWRRARARNAYRRAGLTLLKNARTAREVNIVVKRVALAAFPRSTVAPLWGDAWVAFLDRTCRRARFSSLEEVDADAEASSMMRSMAGTWIQRHDAPTGKTMEGGV
jgi:hypothetical protein